MIDSTQQLIQSQLSSPNLKLSDLSSSTMKPIFLECILKLAEKTSDVVDRIMTLVQIEPDKLCFGLAEIHRHQKEIETILVLDDIISQFSFLDDSSKLIVVPKANKHYHALKGFVAIGVLYYKALRLDDADDSDDNGESGNINSEMEINPL